VAIVFDQTKYIESTKGIIKEYIQSLFPNYEVSLGLPDLSDDNLSLTKPVISLEYNSSVNSDVKAGKVNGHGGRVKRKLLRFGIQILTTGENSAVLERDRIAQTLEYDMSKESTLQQLARQGLKDIDLRYVNAYRVREGVHLCRLELFTKITMTH